jgi:hypothetical protein
VAKPVVLGWVDQPGDEGARNSVLQTLENSVAAALIPDGSGGGVSF